jgi:hypothetical protein
MTDKFEHIIVLNQIKFHPLINVKHNILYTIISVFLGKPYYTIMALGRGEYPKLSTPLGSFPSGRADMENVM